MTAIHQCSMIVVLLQWKTSNRNRSFTQTVVLRHQVSGRAAQT